jgi:hypothetical protein
MSAASTPVPYLVIGTPCYGKQVTTDYAGSLLKLQSACHARGIRMRVHMLGGDALITRARQNIVARFLAEEAATHLLFIDADIGFEPAQVFRLMQFDAPVSAAIYPVKRLDWGKVAACIQEGLAPLQSAALTYTVQFDDGPISVQDGFAKSSYAATGFLMIQREALLRMIEKYPELKYQHEHGPKNESSESKWRYALFNCLVDDKTGHYLSEDYSFCRRWTDIGGEIWIDLQSRLTHVGSFHFEGDFSTQFSASSDPEGTETGNSASRPGAEHEAP